MPLRNDIELDYNKASKTLSNVIAACVTQLHATWLKRCSIVHVRLVDGHNIEKIVELLDEMKNFIGSERRIHLPEKCKEWSCKK